MHSLSPQPGNPMELKPPTLRFKVDYIAGPFTLVPQLMQGYLLSFNKLITSLSPKFLLKMPAVAESHGVTIT